MKRALQLLMSLLLPASVAGGAVLRVEFVPQFNGAPLVFDALSNRTAAGQTVSLTRLDFLLSNVALRRRDGTWLEQRRWFGFIGARDGRTVFTLEHIPPAEYDRIRFHVGLGPDVNHGDAAQWPAGHPLNPDVNHLYWSWSKEYVFLALEGNWRDGSKQSGFVYHLATDRQLMNVELPVALDLNSGRALRIQFDVARIFSGASQIELSDTTDASHSRTNDLLAAQLRDGVENAFVVGKVSEWSARPVATDETNRVEMAADATPCRLVIPSFVPRPNLPRDNPLTVEGVALGRKLFSDPKLSKGNAESCATCHDPRRAFSEPRRFSRGADGILGARNAMSLGNLAWKGSYFWDGRAATLREQIGQPIQNPVEMHETLTNVVAKISVDADYPRLFAGAFGSPEVSVDRIVRALEQFLLAQVSFNSKFDQVMAGKETFTDEEQRGFVLFNTEYDPYHGQHGADCFHCHGGPLFQNQDFANNGLDTEFRDLGRYAVTKREGDRGKFAVPSLRNVAVTGPYMHDGRFATLEEAVEHYCTGMKRSATLDPNLARHPDGGVPLAQADKRALVAFLNTLTDERLLAEATVATKD